MDFLFPMKMNNNRAVELIHVSEIYICTKQDCIVQFEFGQTSSSHFGFGHVANRFYWLRPISRQGKQMFNICI